MLTLKSFFSSITGSTGCTGQNVLCYLPSTKEVSYSVVPVKVNIGGSSSEYWYGQTTSNFTNSSSTPTNIITSGNLTPGIYFVYGVFVYLYSRQGIKAYIYNNETNNIFGDQGSLRPVFNNARFYFAASGLSVLTTTNTFSLRFSVGTLGGSVTVTGGELACVRIS
jgi:hypothetical protein